MPKFKCTFIVEDKMVATLLATVSPEVQLVSVVPEEDTIPSVQLPPPSPKTHKYVNGQRNKGITGVDLAMQFLAAAKRPVKYEEIAKEFIKKGFSVNSPSPVLTLLMKEKKVVRVGPGIFELAP